MEFYGRQIRFSVPVKIRNGKRGVESRRRTRRLLRRNPSRICALSRTKYKTDDQKSPDTGSCYAKTLVALRKHKLQLDVQLLDTHYRVPRQNTIPSAKSARNRSEIFLID